MRTHLLILLLGLPVFLMAQVDSNVPTAREILESEDPADFGVQALDPDSEVRNFVWVETPVDAVLEQMENWTGKEILRQPGLPTNTTISFRLVEPMPLRDVLRATLSLLAMNGVAISKLGDDFLKATATGEVAREVPEVIVGSSLGLAPSEQYFTKLFPVRYLNLQPDAQNILLGLSSGQGSALLPLPRSNAFMVTDKLVNIQRMEQVLTVADNPGIRREQFLYLPLDNTSAAEMAQRLQSFIQNQNTSLGQTLANTQIQADERSNQLIVLTFPENFDLIEDFVRNLDRNVDPRTTSEVFYLKYADAPTLASTLQEIVTGQRQALADDRRTTARAQGQQAQTGERREPQRESTVTTPDGLGALRFSEFVTITSDERTSSVVIAGTPGDIAQLGVLIEKLDIKLAQVFIRVIIAEVLLQETYNSGIDAFNFGYDGSTGTFTGGLSAAGGAFQAGGSSATDGGNGEGTFQFGDTFALSDFDLGIVLNNARSNSDVSILSSPTIAAVHNEEATVDVTTRQPIISGQTTNDSGTTSNTEFVDIGIQLAVTPKIGVNGVIQLEIDQRVDSQSGTVNLNGNPTPVISERQATSTITVRDGDTIVLAGLQENRVEDSGGSLFFLGDLPLVGPLFQNELDDVQRRELVFFIKPVIMDDEKVAKAITDEMQGILPNRDAVEILQDTGNIPPQQPEEIDSYRKAIRHFRPY